MEATLAAAGASGVRVRFVPVSAPLTRGILATSFVRAPADVTDTAIAEAFASTYGNEPFVRIPAARLPEVVAVIGSNHAEVGFVSAPADGATRLVTCFGVTDNLVKGGAGQAIQNMNLMLGVDEQTALRGAGPYP
jgi:N-acetyl-gamma-glutamyl-phosphate reductase